MVTTDEAGTSASEGPPRRWTAFGTLRSGTSDVERGYASQVTEGATGLIYMAARHYDPATGRFLQVDPLGIDAAELYAYAANNPYAFWDPTGLIPDPIRIGDSSQGGILGQQLGVAGRVGVAAVGGASALGVGAAATGVLAATGCVASVVCIAAVGATAAGALAYDLSTGGAGRIADSFSSFFTGDVTVGQALEVGAASTGVAGITGLGVRSVAASSTVAARSPIAGHITGYTRHGLNQVIGRDGGRGVSASAILDAVRSPTKLAQQTNGTTRFSGANATVVLNQGGRVVTAFGQPRRPRIR